MADGPSHNHEPTAVDDVRHVREKIAAQHQGNMREHMEETNRIFELLRAKLNLKVVLPPNNSHVAGQADEPPENSVLCDRRQRRSFWRSMIVVLLVLGALISTIATVLVIAKRNGFRTSGPLFELPAGQAFARRRVDGNMHDWNGISVAIGEIGGNPARPFMNGDVAIRQVRFDNDQHYFYARLKLSPTVAERYRLRQDSGSIGVISFDVDDNPSTGFFAFAYGGDDRDRLAGYEYQVRIDIAVYLKLDLVSRKQEKGRAVCYTLDKITGNPCGDVLDPLYQTIGGPEQEEPGKVGSFIAECSDGVELAVPLQAVNVKSGQTMRVLVRERSLTNPTSVATYRLK